MAGGMGGRWAVGPVGRAYGSANVPRSAMDTATDGNSQRVLGRMASWGTLVRKKPCTEKERAKMRRNTRPGLRTGTPLLLPRGGPMAGSIPVIGPTSPVRLRTQDAPRQDTPQRRRPEGCQEGEEPPATSPGMDDDVTGGAAEAYPGILEHSGRSWIGGPRKLLRG